MKSLVYNNNINFLKNNILYYILFKYNISMSGYNEELNKTIKDLNNFYLNNDNSFGIKQIIDFIIENYKQLLLFLLVFIIIIVVDHITYYNSLFYSVSSVIPGVSEPQPQKKSNTNTLKKKSGKNKK
jgi:hypothetical protein